MSVSVQQEKHYQSLSNVLVWWHYGSVGVACNRGFNHFSSYVADIVVMKVLPPTFPYASPLSP